MKDYDFESETNDVEIDKAWKEKWRMQEKNPSRRREVRQEKKLERRRIHKKNRKNVKEFLRKQY